MAFGGYPTTLVRGTAAITQEDQPMTQPQRPARSLASARAARGLRGLALAAVATLALAACSGTDPDASTDTPGPADPTQTSPTSPDGDAGPDDDAATDDPSSLDLDAARAGLASWLEQNRPATPSTSTNFPDCPLLESAALEEALEQAGLGSHTLGGWGAEIEWSEYSDIDPDLMGVTCGGDTDGNANDTDHEVLAGVIGVDVAGVAAPDEVIAAMLGAPATAVEGQPAGLEGSSSALCFEEMMCFAFWHQDDFLLAAAVLTDGSVTPDPESSVAVLHAVVPQMIQSLSGL